MKKVLAVLCGVIIAGSVAVWKTVDTKVIKQTDEVVTEVLKKSSNVTDDGSKLVKATTKEVVKNQLSVKYFDFTFIRNGIEETIKVADFSKHSVFKTKLPDNLLVAKDELQFSNCLQSLRNSLVSNKEKVVKQFQKQNSIILKRDAEILKANKKDIYEAESKMLEATKNGNLEEQKIWLKELRKRTKDITFIRTYKGKPMKIFNQEEIIEKQIADIKNPNGGSQSRVFGYVWHHNENVGVMELIAKDIHEFNRHTGGNYIWGNNVR